MKEIERRLPASQPVEIPEPGAGTDLGEGADEIRTFLIADIRGSTRFTQAGDRDAGRLASRFAELVREHVEAREGSIVEFRGDEAVSVFRSPRHAICAAVELQSRFLHETTSSPEYPLPVGVGIDAGEAVRVEGGYRAGASDLASRLCGKAAAGEILATRGVTHLARAVDGVRYLDRGEFHPKGMADPVRVVAIVAEGKDMSQRMRALVPRKPRRRVFGGTLRFGILGPLEVDTGGGPIPLGGRQQRGVLALLIVRANEFLSAETLIDEIWRDNPPDTARNTVQTYISHLRKALGYDRIEGGSPGYRLRLDPSELDAARFDALVRNATKAMPVDPALAIGILEDALALWRGPALGDLADQPSLLAESTRLDDLRLQAQEERIEGLLAMGAQARAIGELEALLAYHPLRESLWGLLVLSLYREGRQADALNAYQRAREILADELGIDPSPELTRLHEKVLKQDPALDLRGEPLRGYRLLEEIGEGPTGTVFRAIQPHVGRDVAVKIVHERIASDAAFVRIFEPRAQSAATLEHPHIAPVYDYWREPSRAYIASRYLRGGSLRALQDRAEELEADTAVHVIEQIASALSFAHRQGVAHGHVSAANILFDEEDNAYLADFVDGGGPDPDPSDDVRELAALARSLLPTDTSMIELSQRVESGTEPLPVDAFVEAARTALGHAPTVTSEPGDERNPYKGLRAFTEADAQDFFGRGALIKRLISRLNETEPGCRFLAVVGPSGGGKSSVVRAGVVPAIRHGALREASSPFIAEMFPGAHPIEELESALLRIAVGPVSRLGDRLESRSRGLLDAIELVAPGDAEVVLLVDQFEEVFTLTTTESERELFLESLRVAIADPSSRLRVIVTLRADFYDRPLIYPRLGELLASRTEAVPPLTADELEQVIRRPAEQVGISAEPGLVAEMIGDILHQPGGLPLLQYTLTELFERREGDQLARSAYREMGGMTGALASSAERILKANDQAGRRTTKQVFLRLVTLGEGRQDTRRRVPRRELDALEVEQETVEAVLDTLGRHRLLTFDREPSTREPTVEIAHEALLTAWARLRNWIDHAREDLRQDRRLAQAAAEWRGSGKESSFLLLGARLDQMESWAAGADVAIGRPEREYMKASLDERDRQVATERARQEHEEQLERRSVRRLRGMVAVLAAAALVAASLTVIATNQREEAGREALLARARELVAASGAFLETDSDRSILLAIEAVELTRSGDGTVLPEAEEALHKAIAKSRAVLTVPGVGGALSWSPNGVFVTEGPEGSGMIEIRDEATGEIVLSFRGHDGDVTEVEFSTDGSMLATTGTDGQLKLWDPLSGERLSRVPGSGEVVGLSFSADGSRVAAVWPGEKVVRVASPITGEVDREIRIPMKYAYGTALSPDGGRIAFAAGGPLVVIDLATDERVELATPVWGADGPSWSPNGDYITVNADWGIWLFDATNGDRLDRVRGVGQNVAWSPNSRLFVATQANGIVVFSIPESGTFERTLTLVGGEMTGENGHGRHQIEGVAFSSDGRGVMAGDRRMAAVKTWDLEPRGEEWASIPTQHIFWSDAEFVLDGQRVAANTGGEGSSLRIWEVGSRRLVSRLGDDADTVSHFREPTFDISPDGGSAAIASRKSMMVLNISTGEEVLPMRREGVVSANWSPDGQLLVAAEADGSVSVIDRSGQVVQTLETGWEMVWDARFSPDGRLVAAGNDVDDPRGDQTWIWDWERGEVIAEIPDNAHEIAWDPSGSRIILDGNVWDVQLGKKVVGLPEGIRYAFSPDGSRIARAGTEGVDLFDAATGEKLFVLQDECPSAGVDFSPDGSRIATVDSCNRVRVWAYGIDDLLHLARQVVTRSLTDAECHEFLHLARCPE